MRDDLRKALVGELELHGVSDWRVEHGGVHRHLVFEWQGRTLRHVLAATPSDRRAALNDVAELRHQMGVARLIAKADPRTRAKRRKVKRAARGTPAVRANLVRPLVQTALRLECDPWSVLRASRDGRRGQNMDQLSR